MKIEYQESWLQGTRGISKTLLTAVLREGTADALAPNMSEWDFQTHSTLIKIATIRDPERHCHTRLTHSIAIGDN